MINLNPNIDPKEINKFANMAHQWWDPQGPCKPLHDLNPLRLAFIKEQTELAHQQILDVGCGGGILSEAMAKQQGRVTGIDANEEVIKVAELHCHEHQLAIDYHTTTIEKYAQHHDNTFDVITCMEMLEHVPDPEAIVATCSTLLKPEGKVFFSTLNRNLTSYLFAIIGAEYLLKLLPKGTHEYGKFITPAELNRWARSAGLILASMRGIHYEPNNKIYSLGYDVSVNYIICFNRSEC